MIEPGRAPHCAWMTALQNAAIQQLGLLTGRSGPTGAWHDGRREVYRSIPSDRANASSMSTPR
jgi:hypothetical protein